MIHVILGTKAQMVKMAPVMARLEKMGVPYNFIFTGQHQETIDAIRANFGVKEPNYILHQGKDITSILAMFTWLVKILWHTLTHRKSVFKNDTKGVVLVHGDTFSTLLGALIGKFARLKVAHIESGLRSFNIWHPFPEELTRLLVFKLSDYYFCPGEWAINNLKSYSGVKIDTHYNTLLDAVKEIWQDKSGLATVSVPNKPYCVISTHRFENWVSREVALKNIELIERIVKQIPGVFIMHSITRKKLLKYGLMTRLAQNSRLELRDRYDYRNFIKLVKFSEFVVSDGGSNQEECFYIGKPCLILRKVSERQEGLDKNVVISRYNEEVVDNFLIEYPNYGRDAIFNTVSPSQIICDHLTSL